MPQARLQSSTRSPTSTQHAHDPTPQATGAHHQTPPSMTGKAMPSQNLLVLTQHASARRLTARINSSCPLLVTVTPLARLPFPSTLFCAPRSAARAASSPATSTNAWLNVFPLWSSSTWTRATGCLSHVTIAGGVMSCSEN